MNGFGLLIGFVVVMVLAVLVTGIISMLRGGDFNRRYGNKLMRLRVVVQLIAVLLIFAFFAFVER